MKRWFRRLIYLFIITIWLLVMAFPVVALVLATQNQLQLGSDPNRHLRIFLVQEDDAAGVGIEWARNYRGDADCTRTSVNYLVWEGEAESVSFCQCYEPLTGDLLPQESNRCE